MDTAHQGALVAFADGLDAGCAMSRARPFIPDHWRASVREVPWGAVITAGSDMLVSDDVIVLGWGVDDPWGVPARPIDRSVILERFLRYGAHAVQLAAGPFAIADVAGRSLMSASNGIVPLFSSRGDSIAIGTHPGVVAALAGASEAAAVPAGHRVFSDGTSSNIAGLTVPEDLPNIDLVLLGREVESQLARVRGLKPLAAQAAPYGFRLWASDDHVVASAVPARVPTALGTAQALARSRRRLAALWWDLAVDGRALFVPFFERPCLDTLYLAFGRSR